MSVARRQVLGLTIDASSAHLEIEEIVFYHLLLLKFSLFICAVGLSLALLTVTLDEKAS